MPDLRAELSRLLDVFPQQLSKAPPETIFDREELARNEQFDAILRAHRKHRLDLPIEALRRSGAPTHNFDSMPPRRLAWFVPSLLASWLDPAVSFSISDLEEVCAGNTEFSEPESEALAAFFETALAAALETPLPSAREPDRALQDGLQVWSRHFPSAPLEVLRAAKALDVPLDPLVGQWARDPSPLAGDHLLEAVFDPTVASKHYLSDEAVADRLANAFFEATGEKQLRLSKAEKKVRLDIERRTDF